MVIISHIIHTYIHTYRVICMYMCAIKFDLILFKSNIFHWDKKPKYVFLIFPWNLIFFKICIHFFLIGRKKAKILKYCISFLFCEYFCLQKYTFIKITWRTFQSLLAFFHNILFYCLLAVIIHHIAKTMFIVIFDF